MRADIPRCVRPAFRLWEGVSRAFGMENLNADQLGVAAVVVVIVATAIVYHIRGGWVGGWLYREKAAIAQKALDELGKALALLALQTDRVDSLEEAVKALAGRCESEGRATQDCLRELKGVIERSGLPSRRGA
jgi:hypothetical protein